MGSAEGVGTLLSVQVCYSPAPREVDTVCLQLQPGSTVADALRASGLLERHGLAPGDQLSVGIWTKLRPLDSALRENDRIEIYRQLLVDPKEARRQRYRKQPSKRR
jgi:putative ubiquitin-RnfH superfamily antitoxin RatB of RatAB toxin-antitoxin module